MQVRNIDLEKKHAVQLKLRLLHREVLWEKFLLEIPSKLHQTLCMTELAENRLGTAWELHTVSVFDERQRWADSILIE